MGSNETATATTGGPRVIDVFYGDRARSGPNYLLFSDADRLADVSWVGSEVGWSLAPRAARLELLWTQTLKTFGSKLIGWPRTLPICMYRWKRRRIRCRLLRVTSSDPKRPRGHLLGRD